MNIYKCPNCKNRFFECELIKTKCSENFVGSYIQEYCPKCMNKRKPVFIKLKLEE